MKSLGLRQGQIFKYPHAGRMEKKSYFHNGIFVTARNTGVISGFEYQFMTNLTDVSERRSLSKFYKKIHFVPHKEHNRLSL